MSDQTDLTRQEQYHAMREEILGGPSAVAAWNVMLDAAHRYATAAGKPAGTDVLALVADKSKEIGEAWTARLDKSP